MKIVFFGTPQFAVPSLKALLTHPAFEVLAVVTQPDKRRGRGTQLSPSPIKSVAVEHQLPVWQPKSVKKDPETLQWLQTCGADGFAVVAYGQILSQAILDMPRLGCVNVHGSLLPYYRGAAPIQWSIYHGETETGITTMLMDAGMDTGAMLLKAHTPIALLENSQDLAERLSHLGAELLVETLLKLEQQAIDPIPQDPDRATYAPLIKKPDYRLDWSCSALALHNQIRGFFPNCVAAFRGEALKVTATAPLGVDFWSALSPELAALEQDSATWESNAAAPGTIVAIAKGQGPIVQTGDGYLLLRALQPAGKRPQTGWDFANGARVAVGEVLESGTEED